MTYSPPFTRGAFRLAEEMARRGWRDTDLAEKIGCSQSHATRLRSGLRLPSKRLMFEIQDVCEVDPRDWLVEIDRPKDAA